jgi:hypothetical protein
MRFFIIVMGWAGVTAIAGRVAAEPVLVTVITSGSVL